MSVSPCVVSVVPSASGAFQSSGVPSLSNTACGKAAVAECAEVCVTAVHAVLLQRASGVCFEGVLKHVAV